jgi:hypothetical protein
MRKKQNNKIAKEIIFLIIVYCIFNFFYCDEVNFFVNWLK